MFLLVPAYPGCPGSKAVKRSLLLLFCLFVVLTLMSLLGLYHKILEVGGGGGQAPKYFGLEPPVRACLSRFASEFWRRVEVLQDIGLSVYLLALALRYFEGSWANNASKSPAVTPSSFLPETSIRLV